MIGPKSVNKIITATYFGNNENKYIHVKAYRI